MRTKEFATVALFGITLWLVTGCSGYEPPKPDKKVETTVVSGVVLVDGKPAAQLAVKCYPIGGAKQEGIPSATAFTDKDGKFKLGTYESGDGVPPGKYKLTFFWGQRNLISGRYEGPDKLKGRYANPKKSKFEITVEPGKPLDLGEIKLTTK